MCNRWHSRVGGPYTVWEILPLLIEGKTLVWNGHRVCFSSPRLQTYLAGAHPRTECVRCGLTGTFFVLERDFGGGVHLNLYGINASGHEVMLTSDHIIPRSRGGAANDPNNRQPMCERCNQEKGNIIEPALVCACGADRQPDDPTCRICDPEIGGGG